MNDTAGEFAVEAPFTVGARLAEARKAQALELTEVASRTRVPLRHLEAIEANDLTALPAIPYSVGFVRSYAQLLGLDAPALAREFREEMSGGKVERAAPEPFEPADPARVPSRFLVSVACTDAGLAIPATFDPATRSAVLPALPPGSDVSCVFQNQQRGGTATWQKHDNTGKALGGPCLRSVARADRSASRTASPTIARDPTLTRAPATSRSRTCPGPSTA